MRLTKAQIDWLRHAASNWKGKGSCDNRTAQKLRDHGLAMFVGDIPYWSITMKGRDFLKDLDTHRPYRRRKANDTAQ